MFVLVGVDALHAVQLLSCSLGEQVTVEHVVLVAGKETEWYVANVLHGCIYQRFASGHRTCCCPVVSIERCQSLAAISAFRDTKDIDAVLVHFGHRQEDTQNLFPCPLLAALPPSVPFSFLWYLGYNVHGGTVLEHPCQTQTGGPLILSWARTMQVDKDRVAIFGFLALCTQIEVHACIRLQ